MINQKKINYICPCWSGWRRGGDEIYNKDRSIYMKIQVAMLQKLEHNLDLITIVIPENPDEPKEFTNFLKEFPKKINKVPVFFIWMENTSSSYGPYNRVFDIFRSEFDYYILMEDDYIPIQDNFDNILIKTLEKKKNCGYCCSKVGKCDDGTPIASVSNGLVPSWAFERIRKEYEGFIPWGGQANFSDAFRDTNINMWDTRREYRTPFYGFGSVAWFYHFNEDELIIPVQVFLEPNKFRQHFLPSSWPRWENKCMSLDTFTNNNKYKELFL